jgi:hypothetical protein
VQGRLKLKMDITSIFTAKVTRHEKNRAQLHRFKTLEHKTCPRYKGEQTIDHLINQCILLQTQREIFRGKVLKLQTGANNGTPEIISTFYKINTL